MLARCWQTVSMKTTTVRGIPDELYARIQKQAALNRRSVNGQMLVMLEEASRAAQSRAAQRGEIQDAG